MFEEGRSKHDFGFVMKIITTHSQDYVMIFFFNVSATEYKLIGTS